MAALSAFLNFVIILVIVDAVLSWVMAPEAFPRSLTSKLMEPLYAPIRSILHPSGSGGFDFSPLVIIIVLQVVRALLIPGAG